MMKTRVLSLIMMLVALVAGTQAEVVAEGEGWSLSDQWELTVSKDIEYSLESKYPWYSYKESIKKVVFAEGVKKVGVKALYKYTALTSVEMPSSVEIIGARAFCGCGGLTGELKIPEGVMSIGDFAFIDCGGLTSLEIPTSVSSIGSNPFSERSGLTSIKVDENNPKYDSRGDCNAIIETETNTLIVGCQNTIIPEDVVAIKGRAFMNFKGLTTITIPESVTKINYDEDWGLFQAFTHCSGLTSIKVDENNQVYDSRGDCNAIIETATNTLMSGCLNTKIPEDVTCIGKSAFYGCTGLTSITIPKAVTSIKSDAFRDCIGLTSVEIPSSVTNIGYDAFQNCIGLKSVVSLPSVLPTLDNNIFDCVDLSELTLYVPSQSIEMYKEAATWKDFGKIEALMEVRFEDWDGTEIKSVYVIPGNDATTPEEPTREGYEFTGWDKEYTSVTENVTVRATYKVKTFTVRFEAWDGTEIKTETVEYGKDATTPEEPTREGYEFTGWDKEYTSVTEDVTVRATYKVKTFTVRFEDWDGTEKKTETVEYGKDATTPEEPTREGYEFTGWNKEYTNVTEDVTVRATYEERSVVTSITALQRKTGITEEWHDLTGRRLKGRPSTKGVYIHGSRKVLMK